MKSQEVMEYMHRYLDGDLNDRETERLMEALRQSPESAVMFERLKRLHQDLVQLPKVAPRTSIVDAILPKLDQMEPGGGEAAVRRAVSRTERRPRAYAKWAGTAVAAAVLVLVFVIKPGMPGDSVNELSGAPAAFQADSSASRHASEMTFMNSAANVAEPGKDAAVLEAPPAAGSGAGAEQVNGKQMDKQSPVLKEEWTVMGDDGMSMAAIDGEAEGEISGMLEEGVGMLGMTGFVEDQFGPAAERFPVTEYVAGIPPVGWQVTVELTEGTSQVWILDDSGEPVYVSAVYPNAPVRFQWSEDGQKLLFSYEAGGEMYRVTIDLADRTESSELVAP